MDFELKMLQVHNPVYFWYEFIIAGEGGIWDSYSMATHHDGEKTPEQYKI